MPWEGSNEAILCFLGGKGPPSLGFYFIQTTKPLRFCCVLSGPVNNDAAENIPLIRNRKQSPKCTTAKCNPSSSSSSSSVLLHLSRSVAVTSGLKPWRIKRRKLQNHCCCAFIYQSLPASSQVPTFRCFYCTRGVQRSELWLTAGQSLTLTAKPTVWLHRKRKTKQGARA